MVHFFKVLWAWFSDKENMAVATFSCLTGWFSGFHLLLGGVDFSWLGAFIFVAKTFIGLCITGITVFIGLVVTDYYKIVVKPKIFKKKENDIQKRA